MSSRPKARVSTTPSTSDRRRKRIEETEEAEEEVDLNATQSFDDVEDEFFSAGADQSTTSKKDDISRLIESDDEDAVLDNDDAVAANDDGDENVSDVDQISEDEKDEYDDDLMGDDEDRKRLEALTAVERESILFERKTKREEIQTRNATKARARKLAALQQEAKKKTTKGKKQQEKKEPARKTKKLKRAIVEETAEAEEAEEDYQPEAEQPRRLTAAERDKVNQHNALRDLLRRKTGQDTSSKSSALQADQDEEDEEVTTSRKSKSKYVDDEDEDDMVDDEDEDEDEEEQEPEEEQEEKKLTPLDVNAAKKVQLRRAHILDLIDQPFFREYVKDQLVRIPAPDNSGKYLLAQVVDVVEKDKVEPFEKRSTNLRLLCQRLGKEKEFPLSFISNHSFQENEIVNYNTACEKAGIEVLYKQDVLHRHRAALKLVAHATHADGNTGEFRKKVQKVNLTAFKERLISQINDHKFRLATVRADPRSSEDITELEAKLKELEDKLEETQQEEARWLANANKDKAFKMDEFNARLNATNEKQRAEYRRFLEEQQRKNQESGASAAQQAKRDAFKRKETKPSMNFLDVELLTPEQKSQRQAEEAAAKKKADAAKKIEDEQRRRKATMSKLEDFDNIDEHAQVNNNYADTVFTYSSAVPERCIVAPKMPSPGDIYLANLQQLHKQAHTTFLSNIQVDKKSRTINSWKSLGRMVPPDPAAGKVSTDQTDLPSFLRNLHRRPEDNFITLEDWVVRRNSTR